MIYTKFDLLIKVVINWIELLFISFITAICFEFFFKSNLTSRATWIAQFFVFTFYLIHTFKHYKYYKIIGTTEEEGDMLFECIATEENLDNETPIVELPPLFKTTPVFKYEKTDFITFLTSF